MYSIRLNVSLYGTYNKGFGPFETSTSTQIFNAPYKPVTSKWLIAGAKANFFASKLSAPVAFYQLQLQQVAVNANVIANPNLCIVFYKHAVICRQLFYDRIFQIALCIKPKYLIHVIIGTAIYFFKNFICR